MAAPNTSKSVRGCFSTLITLILLLGAVALGAAVFLIAQPQDLTDIGGYGPAAKTTKTKDIKMIIKNSVERGFPVTLSEEDLNNWLDSTLNTKQGGLFGDKISLDHVWIRLLDGYAEIIMERKIIGRPFTLSMFVTVEKIESARGFSTNVKLDGGSYHPDLPQPLRGGRFGKLVVPQGFLILVMPAYAKLAALFPEERNLGIEEMSRIKIEKGRLILNPRPPSDTGSLIPQTF